jgi:hypothetical protein
LEAEVEGFNNKVLVIAAMELMQPMSQTSYKFKSRLQIIESNHEVYLAIKKI